LSKLSLLIGIPDLLQSYNCEVEPQDYHNYQQLSKFLSDLSFIYPDLAKTYTLSEKTVEGRDLTVIRLGPNGVLPERPLLVPMVKYIANMHGNEPIGREMVISGPGKNFVKTKKLSRYNYLQMLTLTQYLLEEYKAGNERIVKLLNTTDIHILPTMNPDGFEMSTKGVCRGFGKSSGRHNKQGKDLNRDFPDWNLLTKPREELFENRVSLRNYPAKGAIII
jgi:carboxypeptidase D